MASAVCCGLAAGVARFTFSRILPCSSTTPAATFVPPTSTPIVRATGRPPRASWGHLLQDVALLIHHAGRDFRAPDVNSDRQGHGPAFPDLLESPFCCSGPAAGTSSAGPSAAGSDPWSSSAGPRAPAAPARGGELGFPGGFAGPDFAGPGFAGPGFAGPGFAGPGFAGPGFAGPGFAGPGFAGPGFAGPDSAGPDSAGPDSAGPDFAGPDFAARAESNASTASWITVAKMSPALDKCEPRPGPAPLNLRAARHSGHHSHSGASPPGGSFVALSHTSSRPASP